MAKSKTVFRTRKSAPPHVRAFVKKSNDEQFAQLVRTARANRRMAKQMAAAFNFKPDQIPVAARKRLAADVTRAIRAVNGRAPRAPRR